MLSEDMRLAIDTSDRPPYTKHAAISASADVYPEGLRSTIEGLGEYVKHTALVTGAADAVPTEQTAVFDEPPFRKFLKQYGVSPEPIELSSKLNRFAMLVEQWREETRFVSSISDLTLHPAYQEIIGMGQVVVPLILGELRDRGGHWFPALRAITGIEAIRPGHEGDVQAMRADWLDWGRMR